MQRIILALAFLFAIPDPTIAAPAAPAPVPANDVDPYVVELRFEDHVSAHAFYRLWTGGEGREWLEDQTGALVLDYPAFDPDHVITQGADFQVVCYQVDCNP